MIDIIKVLNTHFNAINVLYVEDDEKVALTLSKALKKVFSNVDIAYNGEEGLRLYKTKTYSLVISDIEMPFMNGIAMIKAIKEINNSQKILVTSAYNDSHYLQDLINFNISGYISKPIDLKLLFKMIKEVVQEEKYIGGRESRLEKDYKEFQHYFKSVINGVNDPMMVITKDYEVLLMNDAAQKNIDTRWVADINNPKCYEVSHHRSSPCSGLEHQCPLEIVQNNLSPCQLQHIHEGSDGEKHIVELSAKPVLSIGNEFLGIIETAHDITEQTKTLSHYEDLDQTTNLPNKQFFIKAYTKFLKSSFTKTYMYPILHINISDFKDINNSHGYETGDKVLQSVAERLVDKYHTSAFIASLGADSFLIAPKNMQGDFEITKLLKELQAIMKAPIIVGSHSIYLGCNIGISRYNEDTKDILELLTCAEIAMFDAKGMSNCYYSFYKEKMQTVIKNEVILDSHMHEAIISDEFIVYFQPQVNSCDGSIIGSEALVRWEHPVLGFLSPAEFLASAESKGLLIHIDRIVIEKAFETFKTWYDKGLNPGTISVNITATHLLADDFIEVFYGLVVKTQCEPEWIFVEITEGAVMSDPTEAVNRMNILKSYGIRIAMDDFGTGYSSLSHLKKFPLDKLKIDRSFVIDIPDNVEDMAILNTIMSLAKTLNLCTIVEGVETLEQKDIMDSLGNLEIQGYFYNPPLSPTAFENLLKEQT